LWGRFNSPQLGHSWNASTDSESWLRRMLRLEGEVFLFGTAISAPYPFQVEQYPATTPSRHKYSGRK
jgi:hypothetical protein